MCVYLKHDPFCYIYSYYEFNVIAETKCYEC